jgi:hypothetical protein
MPRRYVVEDGQPGRPKTDVDTTPPAGFSLHKDLMEGLDVRGWYKELGRRHHSEKMAGDPRFIGPRKPDYFGLDPVTDPEELDRLMCRTDVVVECNTPEDLKIAQFNGRLVVEIDPTCPNEIVFDKISALIGRVRSIHDQNTKAWKNHRILALYDLKLLGYDLSMDRKQLALWLFPEISGEKNRGDKFDRATECLEAALASLRTLRAQSKNP